jgi:putative ABC transport system ATP-binding protein
LRFRGVGRRFDTAAGPLYALRHADLDVAQGEFIVVTGRSGAGKTTLLNLAAMLDSPTHGRAEFRGLEAGMLDERSRCGYRKHAVGIVFQVDALLPSRSTYDNVMFRFRYTDVPQRTARDAAGRALARVGLSARAGHPARDLSGGEARRATIARAIAVEPELLLVDEPTANLDAETAHGVMACLMDLNASGITVLLVTHDESLVPAQARRVRCEDGVIDGRAA